MLLTRPVVRVLGRAVRPAAVARRRLSDDSAEAVGARLRALPAAQREALARSILEEGAAAGEAAAAGGGASRAQLKGLFLATAIPMVGFGFVDNAVMISCGEFLEVKLGAAMAISTLAAAGLGNLISDVVGLGAGGAIEAGAARLGFEVPRLSAAQLAGRAATLTRHGASALGISIGCVLGMFPLLFYDADDARLRTIFARYDTDGNGHLDRAELVAAFADARVYPAERDVNHLFNKYDADKDGTIGYAEFCAMMADIEHRMKEETAMGARAAIQSAAIHLATDARSKAEIAVEIGVGDVGDDKERPPPGDAKET